MSIIELIEAGNMDSRLAAMFWVAMEKGASLIIAADPPSSGKTTTLSALMSFTHPDTFVYFTQGEGEQFLLPPVAEAHHTYILVNEMSDHIPVYTWDDNARRVFELLAEGYRLGTTMHDETVSGVLGQLEGQLAIPRSHVSHLTFVVPMYIGRGTTGGIVRRVQEVSMLQPKGEGYKLVNCAEWDPASDTFSVLTDENAKRAFGAWAGLPIDDLESEIEERAAFLDDLISRGLREIPVVTGAIMRRAGYEPVGEAEG
jgi:hypothetical protein